MKIKDLIDELESKDFFKKFKEKNPSYFTAAFLVLDLKEKSEKIQLDYFMYEENKIAAFEFPFEQYIIHDELVGVEKEKIVGREILEQKEQILNLKIDIDDLEEKVLEIIDENKSNLKPTKIICILKDDIWNLTCMNDVLGMVRIKINVVSGEIVDFNKGSLMDFMGIKKK